jgi:hypothetical protein
MGPMTGRGLGSCTEGTNAFYGRGFGRGFGRGQGFGRGRGYYAAAPVVQYPVAASNRSVLENQVKIMKDQLRNLEQKLAETENNE